MKLKSHHDLANQAYSEKLDKKNFHNAEFVLPNAPLFLEDGIKQEQNRDKYSCWLME